jgi:transposase-like protein
MKRKKGAMDVSKVPAAAGAERSDAEVAAGGRRGRPGRRSAEERTRAVLELLSGKATVDQLARRFGVYAETVERWREIALQSIEGALRQGSARSAEQLEVERQLKSLERAFTDLAIRHELVQRALKERPSPPRRSSR